MCIRDSADRAPARHADPNRSSAANPDPPPAASAALTAGAPGERGPVLA